MATCEAKRGEEPIVKRRHEETHLLADWTLTADVRTTLYRLRLGVLVLMASCAVSYPVLCRVLYVVALAMDFLSRNREGKDKLNLSLLYVAGDRLCAMILYGIVVASLYSQHCENSADMDTAVFNSLWLLQPTLTLVLPCCILDFVSNFIYLTKQIAAPSLLEEDLNDVMQAFHPTAHFMIGLAAEFYLLNMAAG